MSTITLNQYAMQLTQEFGRSIGNSAYVQQTERYLNDAIKHILNYWEWPFRETSETKNTVASTGTYTIASTAYEIRGMRIGGSYDVPLPVRSQEQLNIDTLDLELTGQPECYYLNDYTVSSQTQGFGLWPVPDAVYPLIIYERIRSADVASDSNIPLPEDFYACLKDGARHYMERDLRDLNAAQQALQVFEAGLKLLKNRYTQTPKDDVSYYTDVRDSGRRRFPGFTGRYPI